MINPPRLTRFRLFSLLLVFIATPLYFLLFGDPIVLNEPRSNHPAIILDLGGVLMETKKLTSASYLGLKRMMWYYLTSGKSTKKIRTQFYTILNKINGTTGNTAGTRDDEGVLMPELMCAWLRGTRTCEDIRTTTLTAIHAHPEWFSSDSEQIIITRLATMIFTPKLFAKTQQPIDDGIKFVKECKRRGYLVYVLSNWDYESFDLLVKEYQSFFKLFDGIIISGDVHEIKPDSKIYEHFTSRLMPQHCVFIDDRIENIRAAENHGIHGIACPQIKTAFGQKPDFKKVRKKLYSWEKSQIANSSYSASPFAKASEDERATKDRPTTAVDY
jgi:HAD superfamily hydrolase (TIGR01509 family)